MDFSRQKALDFLRYGSLRLNENQLVTPALDHRVILYSVNQILREINIAHRRVLTGDIGVLIKENDPVWVRVVYRSGFLGSNRLGPVRNVIVAGNVVILEGLPFSKEEVSNSPSGSCHAAVPTYSAILFAVSLSYILMVNSSPPPKRRVKVVPERVVLDAGGSTGSVSSTGGVSSSEGVSGAETGSCVTGAGGGAGVVSGSGAGVCSCVCAGFCSEADSSGGGTVSSGAFSLGAAVSSPGSSSLGSAPSAGASEMTGWESSGVSDSSGGVTVSTTGGSAASSLSEGDALVWACPQPDRSMERTSVIESKNSEVFLFIKIPFFILKSIPLNRPF